MSDDDADVVEADCQAATDDYDAETDVDPLDDGGEQTPAPESVADPVTEAIGLGPKGGGWGGASAPVNFAAQIGRDNGLVVTSRKRSWGSTGSDHHTSQTRSDAVDLSNGSAPTPAMDRTARQIAARLGVPNWQYGVLERTVNGYRVQLLYRTNVGGNHFNHVHVGVRVR